MVCICEFVPTFKSFFGSIILLFAFKFATKIYKKLKAAEPPKILQASWKKDRVYLYQFPRSKYTPNLSPFCLKVETFLRAHKIDYEVVETFTARSKNGLVPFIELNGEQIADSQFIIEHLKKYFKIEEPAGSVRAFDRLADNSLFNGIVWDKIVKNGSKTFHPDALGLTWVPEFAKNTLACVVGGQASKRVASRIRLAAGNLTDSEMQEALRADLVAFDAQLGDKPFLFGDRISTADCTLFGHIGSAVDLPFSQTLTRVLQDELPRLNEYVARIKRDIYPQWPRVE